MVDKKQEGVVIRTMKDDLALDAKKPQEFSGPPPPPNPQAPKADSIALPEKKEAAKDSKPEPQELKTPTKKKGHPAMKAIGVLVVVLVLIGGAVGAWWFFFAGGAATVGTDISSGEVASVAELIPGDASIVLRYKADTPIRRSQIEQLWGGVGTDTTLTTLLSGNPMAVFADESIDDVMYILVPGNARAFTVMPKTDTTTNLVAQQSRVQVSEYQGWYILHPINSDQFIESLRVGSAAVSGGTPPLQNNEIAQLVLKPEILSSLQRSVTVYGDVLPDSASQTFSLEYDAADNAVMFKNRNSSTLATTNPALQQILSLVPGDASTVFIGNSFQEIAGNFGIEGPAEIALLQDLDTPYAYYTRDGDDNIFDIGVISAVPEPLQGSLTFDDPVIERLSQALVPVLAGGTSLSNLSFIADFYREVPLRFVNINQTATESVDYTISDDFVFLASSKEGMYALIDTLLSDRQAIDTTDPWQGIISLSGGVSADASLSLGVVSFAPILELLPGGGQQELPYAVVVDPQQPEFIHGALSLTPL